MHFFQKWLEFFSFLTRFYILILNIKFLSIKEQNFSNIYSNNWKCFFFSIIQIYSKSIDIHLLKMDMFLKFFNLSVQSHIKLIDRYLLKMDMILFLSFFFYLFLSFFFCIKPYHRYCNFNFTQIFLLPLSFNHPWIKNETKQTTSYNWWTVLHSDSSFSFR